MLEEIYFSFCQHYSSSLKQCCLNPNCLGESQTCNIIYTSLWFLNESYLYFLTATLLALSLILCKKSIYQKSNFKVEKKFYFELFLKYIAVPSKRSIFFWISFSWFILNIVEDIFYFVSLPFAIDFSTQQNLELIVTSTGIIFPLLLLIIDTKNSNEKGLFSNSEVLLRNALAYPISITLIFFLIYNISGIPTSMLAFLAFLSLALTGFILFKVLEVFFRPEIWKKSEQSLVKHKIYSSIFEIINSRVNHNHSHKEFGKFNPVFEVGYHAEKPNNFDVISQKTGIIESINWIKVKSIYNDFLISETISKGNQQLPPERVTKRKDQEVVIRIYSFPGQELDDSNNILARIYFEEDVDESVISALSKRVNQCFNIISNTESKEATDQISQFLEISMFTGRKALNDRNTYLVKSLTSIYFYIAKTTIECFKYFEIKYNSKTINNENWNIFSRQQGWVSLEGLVENIKDLITYTFDSKTDGDYRLTKEITILPYRLALFSYNHKDLLLFSKSKDLILILKTLQAKNGREKVLSNFDSLLKHYIIPDLEHFYTTQEKLAEVKQFFNNVLQGIAYIACYSLEEDDEQLFKNIVDTFREIKAFRYERLREEIETQKILISHHENDEALEKELAKLKNKLEVKNYINMSKNEISVSLLAYIILLGHDEARVNFKGKSKQTLINYFSILFNNLSFDLKEILNFLIRSNRREIADKWDLGFLEKMPKNRAKTMILPSIIDKVIGSIIIDCWIKAGSPETIDSEEYTKDDVIVFNKEVGFRRDLKSSNDLLISLGRQSLTDETKVHFESFLDKVIKDADLRTSLKICRTPLSTELIEQDFLNFEVSFNENLRIRSHLKTSIADQNSNKGKEWGINTNIPRDSYIDGENYPSFTDHFASDMANNDDEFVYTLLEEESTILRQEQEQEQELPPIWQGSIEEAIREIIARGNELKNLIIVTPRDLYTQNLLSSSENFKFSYQEKLKDNDFCKADGFVEIDEVQIPVFQVFLRNKSLERSIIIFDRTKLNLIFEPKPFGLSNKIGNTGVFIEIKDPLTDNELTEKILAQNPTWLQEYPEENRRELVAKNLWYRAFLKGYIKTEKKTIFAIPIAPDDDTNQ